MSHLKADGPRLASFEVGRNPLENSQELLAEVEEEISRRRRNPGENVSPPPNTRFPPRKLVLEAVHSCSSTEGFNCEKDNEEMERLTDVIVTKERFKRFFRDTGLQAFVGECFEDAFRDGKFDGDVSLKAFIKTYFILPKVPGPTVQGGRSLYWKLLAEKAQLRDEYAKLRHDKSMRDHFEHGVSPVTGKNEASGSEPNVVGSASVGTSSNDIGTVDNAKCPYGFEAGSAKEYKWKGEEFTFDEYDFFCEDKLYDYEVMHDGDQDERAKLAEEVKAEVGPAAAVPRQDTSSSNLRAKDKGHVNPASNKNALDKDGVKSAKSRNHSSEKDGHVAGAAAGSAIKHSHPHGGP